MHLLLPKALKTIWPPNWGPYKRCYADRPKEKYAPVIFVSGAQSNPPDRSSRNSLAQVTAVLKDNSEKGLNLTASSIRLLNPSGGEVGCPYRLCGAAFGQYGNREA